MEPKPKKARHDCDECGEVFAYRKDLVRHTKTRHGNRKLKCSRCDKHFNRRDHVKRHERSHAVQVGGANVEVPENACDEQALGGTLTKRVISGEEMEKYDPMLFLKSRYDEIKQVLKRAVRERGGIKWYLAINVKLSRRKGDDTETAQPHLRGKWHVSLEDVDEGMKESIKKIFMSFVEYQRQGSNWTVEKVLDITVHVTRYRQLRGSSYIPLPVKLGSKHAVVNVQNRDNKCFQWSLLAALHPVKRNGQRVSKYKDHAANVDFKGIAFPVKMADIPRFESQNQISINVFGYQKGYVFPIHASTQRYDRHVNLLIISDGKKSQYCWIKDLNRLLFDQKTHHGRHHFCPYCLHGFQKEHTLDQHIGYCQTHGTQRLELPKESDKWLFYKDGRKQPTVPYVIYADFECLQVPIEGCEKDPKGSYTEKTTKHEPSGFAYKVVGLTPEHSKDPVVYRGSDAADVFVDRMIGEQQEIEQRFKHCEPMHMTGRDWQSFSRRVLVATYAGRNWGTTEYGTTVT